MDDIDKKLLNKIQQGLPLKEGPFQEVASFLEIEEEEVIDRLQHLRDSGYIRRIGGVFNSSSLGYKSTLIAMNVPENCFYKVVEIVNSHPGVTHNYRRDNRLNLWFTLSTQEEKEKEIFLESIAEKMDIDEVYELPRTKSYKLRVFFDMESGENSKGNGKSNKKSNENILKSNEINIRKGDNEEIDELDRALIKEIEGNIPLCLNPYRQIAGKTGITRDQVLFRLQEMKKMGILRRVGGILYHRDSGYTANGMFVCRVSGERADTVGEKLAGLPEVSHCYQRKTYPEWPYNLYAMIHGKANGEVRRTAADFAQKLVIKEHDLLFSTEELKKTSMQFFIEE